jgi:uncharacterized phage protein (TIGR02220 family)
MASITLTLEKVRKTFDAKAHGGERFSGFEATLDLIQAAHPTGVLKYTEFTIYAERWGWTVDQVFAFFVKLQEVKTVEKGEKEGFELCQSDVYYDSWDAPIRKKRIVCQEVIDLFNTVFKRQIELTDYRIGIIWARFQEGKKYRLKTTIESFSAVFKFKQKEWGMDEKMAKHLEIETLCARSNFGKYLDQARAAWLKDNPKPKLNAQGSVS